jgi:hypothetical protein
MTAIDRAPAFLRAYLSMISKDFNKDPSNYFACILVTSIQVNDLVFRMVRDEKIRRFLGHTKLDLINRETGKLYSFFNFA